MSAGLEMEGVLMEQCLKVVGWSSHSRRVLGQRGREVLAGCAA